LGDGGGYPMRQIFKNLTKEWEAPNGTGGRVGVLALRSHWNCFSTILRKFKHSA
jgi:hypothetical protein